MSIIELKIHEASKKVNLCFRLINLFRHDFWASHTRCLEHIAASKRVQSCPQLLYLQGCDWLLQPSCRYCFKTNGVEWISQGSTRIMCGAEPECFTMSAEKSATASSGKLIFFCNIFESYSYVIENRVYKHWKLIEYFERKEIKKYEIWRY